MCGPVGFVTYKLDTNEAGNIQKIDSRQNKKIDTHVTLLLHRNLAQNWNMKLENHMIILF